MNDCGRLLEYANISSLTSSITWQSIISSFWTVSIESSEDPILEKIIFLKILNVLLFQKLLYFFVNKKSSNVLASSDQNSSFE